MWDKRVVKKVEDSLGEFMVTFLFKNVMDGYQWAFVGVYGPNLDRTHGILWDELAGLRSLWDLPWSIGGYFSSERSGGSSFNPPMVDFSNFISEQYLLDIPLTGGSFHDLILENTPPGHGLIDS